MAYTAAKTGGTFDKSALKLMEKTAGALSEGDKNLEELTKDLKYFAYYREAYDAAIGGLVGEYRIIILYCQHGSIGRPAFFHTILPSYKTNCRQHHQYTLR